jgi:hypothetical protein
VAVVPAGRCRGGGDLVVEPDQIPRFAGDLDALEGHAADLARAAHGVARTGAGIDRAWQGLQDAYDAPEAGRLLDATEPVRRLTAGLADDTTQVARILTEYAGVVRPIAELLERLHADGEDLVTRIAGDADWRGDEGLVGEHNDLLLRIQVATSALMAAERQAANAINALTGAGQYHPGGDDALSYGFDPGAPEAGAAMPWGTPAERDKPWYEDLWDGTVSVVEGVVWDGFVNGDVRGALNLVGFWGHDGSVWSLGTLTQTLGGLSKLARIATDPTQIITNQYSALPGLEKGEALRTVKEVGKSFLAWDQWEDDGPRAAGAVAYNAASVLTVVLKIGSAGKVAGAAGKAAEAGDAGAAAVRAGEAAGPGADAGRAAAAFAKSRTAITDLVQFLDKQQARVPTIDQAVAELYKLAKKWPAFDARATRVEHAWQNFLQGSPGDWFTGRPAFAMAGGVPGAGAHPHIAMVEAAEGPPPAAGAGHGVGAGDEAGGETGPHLAKPASADSDVTPRRGGEAQRAGEGEATVRSRLVPPPHVHGNADVLERGHEPTPKPVGAEEAAKQRAVDSAARDATVLRRSSPLVDPMAEGGATHALERGVVEGPAADDFHLRHESAPDPPHGHDHGDTRHAFTRDQSERGPAGADQAARPDPVGDGNPRPEHRNGAEGRIAAQRLADAQHGDLLDAARGSRMPGGEPWPETPLQSIGDAIVQPLPQDFRWGPNGLIDAIEGKPVQVWLHDKLRKQVEAYLYHRKNKPFVFKNDVGPVCSVAVDLRTGRVYEGTNRLFILDEPPVFHPILQTRLDELDGFAEANETAYLYPPRPGFPAEGGYPHYSTPGMHAEVHAINRALFEREALGMKVTTGSLKEFIVDNEFLEGRFKRKPALFCPNCTSLLEDVQSIPGRRPTDEFLRVMTWKNE